MFGPLLKVVFINVDLIAPWELVKHCLSLTAPSLPLCLVSHLPSVTCWTSLGHAVVTDSPLCSHLLDLAVE